MKKNLKKKRKTTKQQDIVEKWRHDVNKIHPRTHTHIHTHF